MNFYFFWSHGLEHITDINGYDHILFITALTAVYRPTDWKRIAWLVTFFTLGHSLSLALATFQVVSVNPAWIELLIPITILVTCLHNIFLSYRPAARPTLALQGVIVTFFGLIHGLGFSNYIRMMLLETESVFTPLLAFNLGLEVGQLFIVALAISLQSLFIRFLGVPSRWWNRAISALITAFAIYLTIQRL